MPGDRSTLKSALAACLLATGCAHLAGPPPPERCLEVVALDAAGASLVRERVGADPPRFHLQRAGERAIDSFTAARCRERAECDERGEPLLETLRLSPAAGFEVGAPALPGELPLPLPGGVAGKLTLKREEDRYGGRPWFLQLEREGRPPQLAWAYPGELPAVRARFLRAGDRLWTELHAADGAGGLRCAVVPTDLKALVSQALDADGVALLQAEQVTEAEGPLRQALEVNPEDATAAYNLACALALSARPEEAMKWLAHALQRDPQRLRMTARGDSDLDSLRTREDFQALTAPKGLDATP